MNVYSDADGTAIRFLENLPLPPLTYVGGDFNCRSSLWDEKVRAINHMAQTLSDVMSSHGLVVRLPPTRRCTHYPANGHHPSIIDLVFLPSDDTTASVHVGNRGESDHAPIFTTIKLHHTEAHTKPSIKPESDKELVEQVLQSGVQGV